METNSSPRALACSLAALMARSSSRDGEGADTVAPLTLGSRRSAASAFARTSAGSAPTACEQRAGDAVGLLQQRDEQVQRLQRGLAAVDRQPLGGGDGFLRTGGELALHGRGRCPLGCGATGATGRDVSLVQRPQS